MQEPGRPSGSSRSPPRTKRRRQERTVYSAEQRQKLEKFFERNRYPTYQDRETLAAWLDLQEQQVQVWFKNRRAKVARLLGLPRRQGPGARGAPLGPGARAPAPAPAPAGPVRLQERAFPEEAGLPQDLVFPEDFMCPEEPVFSSGPVCSEGPGFCSPAVPRPFAVFPEAEPSVSSHSQAWWDPGQGAQGMVPAAPAPAPAPAQAPAPAPAAAPVQPQGSYASNFSPDPVVTPESTELRSSQDPLEGPSCSSTSGYQEGENFVDKDDVGLWMLLDL